MRNFKIPEPQPFYIRSLVNLYSTQKFPNSKIKKISSAIWKINISQIGRLLNISGVQMISKILKIKFENKNIE